MRRSDGLPDGWERSAPEPAWWQQPRNVFVVVVAVVIVSLFVYGAVKGDDEIDPAYRQVVDTLEADRDCGALQEVFDASDDVDELRYADAAMRSAGCYGG